jgi:hypothetical protein
MISEGEEIDYIQPSITSSGDREQRKERRGRGFSDRKNT